MKFLPIADDLDLTVAKSKPLLAGLLETDTSSRPAPLS